jgi:hypothetical protein
VYREVFPCEKIVDHSIEKAVEHSVFQIDNAAIVVAVNWFLLTLQQFHAWLGGLIEMPRCLSS